MNRKAKDIGDWAASIWNHTYPPGTEVYLTDDFGEVHRTKTRSVAWLLGHGDPVVKVEGRSGGYLLYRIRPVGAEA